MAEVSFICKRTVVSTVPVQPGKLIPLSALDRIMERNHLHMVFYYQLAPGRKPGELIEKLRESISEMLTSFPLVVGRLLRDSDGHWMIKCNDAGLRMVEAKAKGTVKEWLMNVDREKELKLVHWEEMFHKPYFWSPFCVQITEFEGGGLAIGLSCIHLLADPVSATFMIKAWADTTLHGKVITLPQFNPLSPQTPRNKHTNHQPSMINHYKSVIENSSPIFDNKKSTITVLFNQDMVESCIAMGRNSDTRDHEQKLSPFEALAALFWTRISKIKGTKSALVNMSICLDTRKVLNLDNCFFGNYMVYNKVQKDGLDETDMSKAAAAIKKSVSKMDGEAVTDLIEWLGKLNCKNPPLMNGCDLIIVNLENVSSYSAIFEDDAIPIRTSYYIEPAVGPGQVLILPRGGNTTGQVVMITLPEGEAEKLLDGEVIQEFSPIVLMGLNKMPT